MKPAYIILFLIAMSTSCKKEAGVGGDASIQGQLWARDYNSTFTNIIGEYPAEDEYVYIRYGDGPGYNKRIKTDYEGKFIFEYLYEGNYTIYAYSADTTFTELDGQIPVIQQITISERKEKKDIGKLIIAK